MARILHVENEQAWIEIARSALADHQVDSADTYEKALILIRDSPPYDLALVDLNLVRDNDGLGGEILDLLRLDHPKTRRIVVTARPPSGGLRANIFERYGADEILIKGQYGLPDLRRAVSGSLSRIDEVPADPETGEFASRKTELRQRYRDWSEHVERIIGERTAKAADDLTNAERLHGHFMTRAKAGLERWHELQKRFATECARLEKLLAEVATTAELRSASETLGHAESRFAREIEQESNGSGG